MNIKTTSRFASNNVIEIYYQPYYKLPAKQIPRTFGTRRLSKKENERVLTERLNNLKVIKLKKVNRNDIIPRVEKYSSLPASKHKHVVYSYGASALSQVWSVCLWLDSNVQHSRGTYNQTFSIVVAIKFLLILSPVNSLKEQFW